MTPIDFVTLCAFVATLVLGGMVLMTQDLRNRQPAARIRARMVESFSSQDVRAAQGLAEHETLFAKRHRRENFFTRWLEPKLARIRTVAGASGLRFVIGAGALGEVIALLMVNFMPLPDFLKPFLVVFLPVFATMQGYRFLIRRFRQRFLDGFPDVIDTIVRAVRAGVPVTHVMSSAADESPEPLRSEFRLMGDALQLGINLDEVLKVAMRRIEIPDFAFFCVCLTLQRETGGQLGETLENLAGIVRTRREIRQKTKALTGEARITTKILASIPVVIILLLYVLNRSYTDTLFGTEAGHKLLTFATISVVIGVMVISKMSKLDTAR